MQASASFLMNNKNNNQKVAFVCVMQVFLNAKRMFHVNMYFLLKSVLFWLSRNLSHSPVCSSSFSLGLRLSKLAY